MLSITTNIPYLLSTRVCQNSFRLKGSTCGVLSKNNVDANLIKKNRAHIV